MTGKCNLLLDMLLNLFDAIHIMTFYTLKSIRFLNNAPLFPYGKISDGNLCWDGNSINRFSLEENGEEI